jgi:small neutral amino acid transporter SnatA (MarC family)
MKKDSELVTLVRLFLLPFFSVSSALCAVLTYGALNNNDRHLAVIFAALAVVFCVIALVLAKKVVKIFREN